MGMITAQHHLEALREVLCLTAKVEKQACLDKPPIFQPNLPHRIIVMMGEGFAMLYTMPTDGIISHKIIMVNKKYQWSIIQFVYMNIK